MVETKGCLASEKFEHCLVLCLNRGKRRQDEFSSASLPSYYTLLIINVGIPVLERNDSSPDPFEIWWSSVI